MECSTFSELYFLGTIYLCKVYKIYFFGLKIAFVRFHCEERHHKATMIRALTYDIDMNVCI